MSQQFEPMVIWVIGDNTNVGKTTVSASLISNTVQPSLYLNQLRALGFTGQVGISNLLTVAPVYLRVLNAAGKSAVGFKPYAGARLLDVVDFLADVASVDGFWVGKDARMLAQASPLTSNDLLEVVSPSWRISHPGRDVSVFIRKGSAKIGRKSFYHTENAVSFLQRHDTLRLNRHTQLPFAQAQPIQNVSADHVDFMAQDIQTASFDYLSRLGPRVVVCEGAGRLLPVWQNAPAVQHIFLVSSGRLYVFPNVEIKPFDRPLTEMPPTTASVVGELTLKKHLKGLIPVARNDELAVVMDAFVSQFVSACF
jgi:hypothetical protein